MAGKQKGAPKSKRRKGAHSGGCRPTVCGKPYDDHYDGDDAPPCILLGDRFFAVPSMSHKYQNRTRNRPPVTSNVTRFPSGMYLNMDIATR